MDLLRAIRHFWDAAHRAWIRWAEFNGHAGWFMPLLGVIVFVDGMLVVLPGDLLVVLSTLANVRRNWWRTALAATLGRTAAFFTLYLLSIHLGAGALHGMLDWTVKPESWAHAQDWFGRWGLLSIPFFSLLPFAAQLPPVLAGLSHADPLPVAGAILAGNALRYLIICFGLREGWAALRFIREHAHREKEKALKD
jgi:membrane protein DedA with SNARE-associated domain